MTTTPTRPRATPESGRRQPFRTRLGEPIADRQPDRGIASRARSRDGDATTWRSRLRRDATRCADGRIRAAEPSHSHDSQHGGASVVALGVGLCVLVFAMVILLLAAAIEARHRAQISADVAALAGAMRAGQGSAPACERAAQLAAANHTTILDCELSGLDVTVEVVAPLPGPLRHFGPVIGHARAGPIVRPTS